MAAIPLVHGLVARRRLPDLPDHPAPDQVTAWLDAAGYFRGPDFRQFARKVAPVLDAEASLLRESSELLLAQGSVSLTRSTAVVRATLRTPGRWRPGAIHTSVERADGSVPARSLMPLPSRMDSASVISEVTLQLAIALASLDADPDGATGSCVPCCTRQSCRRRRGAAGPAAGGVLSCPSSPTASALLRRSRNAPACLKVSADEGERQDGCNHGVPLPDGAKARKAGSGVERITRQCCCGPAADIPHVVRPCRGNGAQAQDEVPDADCPHEQQIGTGRLPLA